MKTTGNLKMDLYGTTKKLLFLEENSNVFMFLF